MQTLTANAETVATALRDRGVTVTVTFRGGLYRSEMIRVLPSDGLNAALREVLGDRWSSRRLSNGTVEISWRR